MKKFIEKHTHLLHRMGLGLSFLCAVHCLAMPFLLVSMPLLGDRFFTENVEIGLILGSLLLGVSILIKDYRYHDNKRPLLLFCFSFLFVVVHFVSHNHLLLSISSVLMA
ncbi:MAG: hypothetical protein ACI9QN_000104, partial [Arcticibacterium sp.]